MNTIFSSYIYYEYRNKSLKISLKYRTIAFILAQFFLWTNLSGFANTLMVHDTASDTKLFPHGNIATQDECIIQSSSATEKPFTFDLNVCGFIKIEEEQKSERKSGLSFAPFLFVALLIDYLFSEVSRTTLFLTYSKFSSFHSNPIFLLDCVFLI